MLGVDQGQDGIQQVAFGDLVVHEEGLRHRTGVGQAGGFDHDPVERQLPGALFSARSRQVPRAGLRGWCSRSQPLLIWTICSWVSDTRMSLSMFSSPNSFSITGNLLAVGFRQHALEQRGLARAKETCEDGGGNECT